MPGTQGEHKGRRSSGHQASTQMRLSVCVFMGSDRYTSPPTTIHYSSGLFVSVSTPPMAPEFPIGLHKTYYRQHTFSIKLNSLTTGKYLQRPKPKNVNNINLIRFCADPQKNVLNMKCGGKVRGCSVKT